MSEESFDKKKVGDILKEFYDTESTHLKALKDFAAILANPNAQQRLNILLGEKEAKEYIKGVNDAIQFSEEIQKKCRGLFSLEVDFSIDELRENINKLSADELREKINELSSVCSDFDKIVHNIKYCKKLSESKKLGYGMSDLLKSFALNSHEEILFAGYPLMTTQRAPRYEMLFKELHKETEHVELKKDEKYKADWYDRISKANRALNSEIKYDDLRRYLASGSGIKVSNIDLEFNHLKFFEKLVGSGVVEGLSYVRDNKNKGKLKVMLNGKNLMEISVSTDVKNALKKYKTMTVKFTGTDYGKDFDLEMAHEKLSKFIKSFQKDFDEYSQETEKKPVYKVVINKGINKSRVDTPEEVSLRKLPKEFEKMAKKMNEPTEKPDSVASEPAVSTKKIETEEDWSLDNNIEDKRTPDELKKRVQEGITFEMAKKENAEKLKRAREIKELITEKTPHIRESEEKLIELEAAKAFQPESVSAPAPVEEIPPVEPPKIEKPKPPEIAPKPARSPLSPRVAAWEAKTEAGRIAARGTQLPPMEQTVQEPGPVARKPISDKMEALRRKFENPPPKP